MDPKRFPPSPLEGRAVLAPMAGITDSAFRVLCRRQGAALVYSEMLSAEALVRRHGKTLRMAGLTEAERPVFLQLFGTRPEAFAGAIAILDGLEPDGYDLNFGCPAHKIVKNGGGSALLQRPDIIRAIAAAAVAATPRPVTAKIRSGWEIGSENAVEVAKLLEDCGVAAITVHGRTRSQMFAGRSDWTVIAAVKQAVGIPVIGNGDIWCGADARKMFQETGCDLVMIGRAALGDPWIFAEVNSHLREAGGEQPMPAAVPWAEKLAVIREHLDRMVRDKGELRGVREMRKHLAWYIKGMAGAAHARCDIMKAERATEVMAILERLEAPVPGEDGERTRLDNGEHRDPMIPVGLPS